jgi:hypothetical protein
MSKYQWSACAAAILVLIRSASSILLQRRPAALLRHGYRVFAASQIDGEESRDDRLNKEAEGQRMFIVSQPSTSRSSERIGSREDSVAACGPQ